MSDGFRWSIFEWARDTGRGSVHVYRIRKMRVRFTREWEELIVEVSEELGMDRGDVERIVEAFWRWVVEMIGHVDLFEIRLVYLGRFMVKLGVLDRYCEKVRLMVDTAIRYRSLGMMYKGIRDIAMMQRHMVRLSGAYMRIKGERDRLAHWAQMRRLAGSGRRKWELRHDFVEVFGDDRGYFAVKLRELKK